MDNLRKLLPSLGFIFIFLTLVLLLLFGYWIKKSKWYSYTYPKSNSIKVKKEKIAYLNKLASKEKKPNKKRELLNKIEGEYKNLHSGFYRREKWHTYVNRTSKNVSILLPNKDGARFVILRVTADYPDISEKPVLLNISINGKKDVITFNDRKWRDIELPYEASPDSEFVKIEWEVDRTWTPNRVKGRGDSRILGITVEKVYLSESRLAESEKDKQPVINCKKVEPGDKGAAKKAASDGISSSWGGDFSLLEKSDDMNWRWCGNDGKLVITNNTKAAKLLSLTMEIGAFVKVKSRKVTISGESFSDTVEFKGLDKVNYQKDISLARESRSTINFHSDEKPFDIPADKRSLVFTVYNFEVKEKK